MHRKRGASLQLKDILERLREKTEPATKRVYKIIYATSDIEKAKTVLDRLLSLAEADRNEVRYSREVTTELDELDELSEADEE